MVERAVLSLSLAVTGVVAVTLTGCTSAASTTAASPGRTRAAATSAAASTSGTLETRTIPGGSTGFAARPAVVYLPAAARTHPRERFPVLILLHGTEGGPTNWTTRGHAREALDRFAAEHQGRAPVVVMPDVNGTLTDDTECIRTRSGADVERYLRTVVPAWIRTHLPVVSAAAGWGIAGASEGGTCALMLALRSASTWTFAGDFSGLRRPTVGDTDNPAKTIATLFAGSRSAYEAHDPMTLLRRHRYPQLRVWFECGVADTAVVADQTLLTTLARRSVRTVHTTTTAGRHSWSVWQKAFASALPAFWAGAT